MDNIYKGQLSLIDNSKLNIPIHIIGVGGIGSWTALLLAKMGCTNITIYDDDVVEIHNTASQFFKHSDLGKKKTEAIMESIKEFSGITIKIKENIEEEKIKDGLVIMAIDSMKERIRLGEIYKDKFIYIIDGRMGGLQAEIYASKAPKYLETTIDPDKVDKGKCTEKAISFNCAYISSMISNLVRMFAMDLIDVDSKQYDFIYLFENNTILKQSK